MIFPDSFGVTHPGRIRSHNEDRIGIFQSGEEGLPISSPNLFVIADGIGGEKGGAKASQLAVETIRDVLYQNTSYTQEDVVQHLNKAILAANQRIYSLAQKEPKLRHMGSTLTALASRGQMAVLAHVGDSRAYIVRNRKVTLLTNDHLTYKGHLYRSLGDRKMLKLDVRQFKLHLHDWIILCSDGLIDGLGQPLEDLLPQFLITSFGTSTPGQLALRLLGEALPRSPDNISIIAIHFADTELKAGKPPLSLSAEETFRLGRPLLKGRYVVFERWDVPLVQQKANTLPGVSEKSKKNFPKSFWRKTLGKFFWILILGLWLSMLGISALVYILLNKGKP